MLFLDVVSPAGASLCGRGKEVAVEQKAISGRELAAYDRQEIVRFKVTEAPPEEAKQDGGVPMIADSGKVFDESDEAGLFDIDVLDGAENGVDHPAAGIYGDVGPHVALEEGVKQEGFGFGVEHPDAHDLERIGQVTNDLREVVAEESGKR